MSAGELRETLASIRRRIGAACERAGRDAAAVELVAVTKTQPVSVVREAVAAGLTVFGENRVQEAIGKIEVLSAEFPGIRWKMIGRLQTNKAKAAVKFFAEVQSVDRIELVEKLAREAEGAGRVLPVLLEVHLGGEATKGGAAERELSALLESAAGHASLDVRGLMTVPPPAADPEEARPWFRRLAGLARELSNRTGNALPELSMGMSHDFEVAIEEGATQVRLGTALFGARSFA